jgi:hypothetical protein
VRPATVWLPNGNPYSGYSVNPALAGTANAAAFTSAIQAAINSAGAAATPTSRKIVLLKAGTYFVNPQIYPGSAADQIGIYLQVDNVTIRGEGANTTRIAANGTINNYGTVILFGHRVGRSDADFAVQNVTADAAKGARTIQVANASAYVVGDVITIDHLDGVALANGPAYLNGGYIWFYDGEYFKRQPTYSWNGPSTGALGIGAVTNIASANSAALSAVPTWRSTMQETEIAAISGNVITIRDPLNIDFPLSTSPQVWRTVPLNTGSVPVGNRWCGIENIAVAGGNNMWGFPGGTVTFSYMAYSWAKNVEADGDRWSNPPDPAHPGKYGYNIGIGRGYRCVIRDSHTRTDRRTRIPADRRTASWSVSAPRPASSRTTSRSTTTSRSRSTRPAGATSSPTTTWMGRSSGTARGGRRTASTTATPTSPTTTSSRATGRPTSAATRPTATRAGTLIFATTATGRTRWGA